MQLLQEITEWPDNTPNHTYLLNNAGKLIAYKKEASDTWEVRNKALFFSKSHRKFKKLPFPDSLNGLY